MDGRHRFPLGEQIPKQMTDFDGVARFGAIKRDAQNTAVDGFDFLRGLVAFQGEEGIACRDEIAVPFQPLEESAFLHGPAETGYRDVDGHGYAEAGCEGCCALLVAHSRGRKGSRGATLEAIGQAAGVKAIRR